MVEPSDTLTHGWVKKVEGVRPLGLPPVILETISRGKPSRFRSMLACGAVMGLLSVLWLPAAPSKPPEARFDPKVFYAASNAESPQVAGKVPYPKVLNFFGYVKPRAFQVVPGDASVYDYVYLWLPNRVEEVGLRMVSPWKREYGTPDRKNDALSSNWSEGEKDTPRAFDPYVRLERSTISEVSNLTPEGLDNAKWFRFGENDDSAELPAHASGSNQNALFRYPNQATDPLKGLARGLYRIGYGSDKGGLAQGSFLLQVGVSSKTGGFLMGTDLPSLQTNALAAETRKK